MIVALGMILGSGASSGQVRRPADFTMKQREGSPGPVVFSHDKHLAKVERCTTCHARAFKMKRDETAPMTMEVMQEGKLCGACHDGTRRIAGAVVFALDNCDRCHGS
jgi:c(7)-type cytochrome triheme protein